MIARNIKNMIARVMIARIMITRIKKEKHDSYNPNR